ncbi:PspC domain-containing protein [Nesterenkonia lutea]|uniref:Phage shock protein PspC (Stress-responsive transcriptional regulator) n=1 Tax=Nesterenkonia lutea TaxID=272919 RepID=A0ABR9JB64_9MICC|nr:PspC domain-containing protein [Nesterenkonia lutea]MBE1523048.1 phage shock protein PspC (stress-responsive transcriptional regulator) [Nesterenkonia lutea]
MENLKPETGHRFFSWMRSTGLRRPDEGWVGGVFAGLSEKVGWDAALVRGLGVVAFIIFFSPAALLYGLVWILAPNREGEIHAQQAVRGSYSSGFIGGAVLAVVGALNIFTPISIAGPLAVLLNVVILGAVAWLIYIMVKNHRGDPSSGTRAESGTSAATRASSTGGSSAAGKARAGDTTPPRADGKPAWYPKEAAPAQPSGSAAASASMGHGAAGPSGAAGRGGRGGREPRPERGVAVSPREQAQRRRRRQLTWGLGLLALPVIVALSWFSGSLGLSAITAALVATAGLVLLLGTGHLVSALRGRPGLPGLLGLSTAVMLVLFAGHTGVSGLGGGTNHAFGNYFTEESDVNSAFSNTTVDLRESGGTGAGGSSATAETAQVNNAFSNTTVIVPDDARVVISNGQALSNLEISTQDDRFDQSGISGEDLVLGPEDADREILLDLNSAFANTTVYDATTYEQQVEEDQ